MSYIEFDPTIPASFENYIPIEQRRKNKFIKRLIVVGITCVVIYLIFRKPNKDNDEDIFVS
jgi:hypothetical protein